jgi:hypothetical protein
VLFEAKLLLKICWNLDTLSTEEMSRRNFAQFYRAIDYVLHKSEFWTLERKLPKNGIRKQIYKCKLTHRKC